MRIITLFAALVLGMGSLGADARRTAHDAVAEAAADFLASLSPEQRATASLPVADENRLDWHYTPRPRRGLAIRDMAPAQREAAHRLMRATLSDRGYLRANAIMELEVVLREMAEAAGRRADYRDPELYYVTVFGEPGSDAWAWRLEGHHLSLNVSAAGGGIVGVTPYFTGANPAQVRGPHRRAGFEALGEEAALAWRLLGSLSDEQRGTAIIADRAPQDVILSPGVDRLDAEAGLALADMTPEQKAMAIRLVHGFVDDLGDELAHAQLDRLAPEIDRMRFAWMGATEPGNGHYWRLHAGSFVLEYDNTQNGANHVHAVWRDLEHDFGGDVLREHLERDHGGR